MASQGKRMVPEYLIKFLEGLYNSGIDPTGFQPKLTAGDGIAIDEDNEITYDPETAAPLMENIVDSAGNKRFVEGNIPNNEIEGVSFTSSKWSLSGTHLMLVIAFSVASGTILSAKSLGSLNNTVPQYILDKIVPLSGNRIDFKTFAGYTSDLTQVQSLSINFAKVGENYNFVCSSFTASYDLNFRVQFDLLIDAD